MSGGTWTLQDKLRPGAYVKFTADPSLNLYMPGNGVVSMALEMSWGEEQEITEIYATDMFNGNVLALTGYPGDHEKNMALKEALSCSRKVLAYRVNHQGTKAAATLGALTATARYPGLRGNDICVSVSAQGDSFWVTTFVDNNEVDRQVLPSDAVPLANDWVIFSASDNLTAAVVTRLTGGNDGTADLEDYGDFFDTMKNKDWQVMVIPSENTAIPPLIDGYIRDLRENCGKKVQGVVADYPGDYEGIINVDQGYVRGNVTVPPHMFTAWAAGASAGAQVQESNTYRVIENAETIINEVTGDALEEKLKNGYFLLSRRTDGAIVVEQDINSLATFQGNKSNIFRKNRVLRTLDRIANGISQIFEKNYIGTMSNNAEGRDLFKQEIIAFLNELQGIGALDGFEGAENVQVAPGANSDSVVVNLAVRPVDSMEKLYMTVEVTK